MNIGGAWLKKTKEGATYMSCQISTPGLELNFALFKNTEKTTDKHPDYTIVWSKPKKDASQEIQDKFGGPATGAPVSNDDIPF